MKALTNIQDFHLESQVIDILHGFNYCQIINKFFMRVSAKLYCILFNKYIINNKKKHCFIIIIVKIRIFICLISNSIFIPKNYLMTPSRFYLPGTNDYSNCPNYEARLTKAGTIFDLYLLTTDFMFDASNPITYSIQYRISKQLSSQFIRWIAEDPMYCFIS